MFNIFRKKDKKIRVMHYEGISEFATDYPCTIELKDDVFEIIRIKPSTTVTLPRNRIKNISMMEEPNFMLKYHGQAVNTSKAKGIHKIYLVVEYDKGYLAFWGTEFEMGKFLDMTKNFNNSPAPTDVSL